MPTLHTSLVGFDSNINALCTWHYEDCVATPIKVRELVSAVEAHDIGNPPFGHYGEAVLNELSLECGGFEGNAQAFRVVRTLEKKHYTYSGLNLNIRTLMAMTKYHNTKQQNDKKFLYDNDYCFLEDILKGKGIAMTKSIDAEIMDLADEIAYAAHDLEDALSFGMISLDEIMHEFLISESFKDAYDDIQSIINEAREFAINAKQAKTSEEYAMILKKELTSIIVHKLCRDITLVDNKLGYKRYAKLAKGLKKLLFKALLRKKDIQLYERKGERIIRGLFEVYSDEKYNKDNILLPPELRGVDDCQIRLVTDYIAGMMDSYAEQEYEKYFGKGSASKLYF